MLPILTKKKCLIKNLKNGFKNHFEKFIKVNAECLEV